MSSGVIFPSTTLKSGREIISAPVASFATVDATAKMEAAMNVLLKFI